MGSQAPGGCKHSQVGFCGEVASLLLGKCLGVRCLEDTLCVYLTSKETVGLFAKVSVILFLYLY